MKIVMSIVMGIVMGMCVVATNSNTRRNCVAFPFCQRRCRRRQRQRQRPKQGYLHNRSISICICFWTCNCSTVSISVFICISLSVAGFNELALISFQKLWHILMGDFAFGFEYDTQNTKAFLVSSTFSTQLTNKYPNRAEERELDSLS